MANWNGFHIEWVFNIFSLPCGSVKTYPHIPCIVKKSIGDGKKLLIYSTRTYHIILWYHPFRRVDFSLHTYRCHHLHCPHWVWLASYGSYIQALLCSIQPCCKRKKKWCRLIVGCWRIGLEVFFIWWRRRAFVYLLVFGGIMDNWSLTSCPVVEWCGMCFGKAFDCYIETFGSAHQLMWYQQHGWDCKEIIMRN